MDRYIQGNAASRQRLRDLIARLDDEAIARRIDEEWTIGAALAYVEEVGRTFILDRASHRAEHLEQIDTALAR